MSIIAELMEFDREREKPVERHVKKTQIWSRLLLEHVPIWFEEMLVSLDAIAVKDSDSLMWHHRNDRTHLGITTDKILFYAKGNPLQYRTFYGENE